MSAQTKCEPSCSSVDSDNSGGNGDAAALLATDPSRTRVEAGRTARPPVVLDPAHRKNRHPTSDFFVPGPGGDTTDASVGVSCQSAMYR